MIKSVVLFIVNLICCGVIYSQENTSIKIGLKDNHYSNITGVLLTKDGKKIITGDATGKILMFNTTDFSYEKTIRKSSGVPVNGMRLMKNDSILMISQKNEYSYGATDSLEMISLKDNKILLKEQRQFTFLGNIKSDVIIANTSKNYNSIIEVFEQNLNKLLKFETDKVVKIAEVSKDKSKVIYTEGDLMSQKNILVRDVATTNIIKQVPIPENVIIVHLFFDENPANFYVVGYSEIKKEMVVYLYKDSINWDKPVFSMHYASYNSDTIISDTVLNDSHTIIFTSNTGYTQKPILLKKEGGKFSAASFEIDKTASHSLLIASKKETVFFHSYNPNFSDIASFSVYDISKRKIIGEYPKTTSGFYSGTFLPEDNWMVMERNTPYGENVKLYEAGTFKNRFDKMNIKNYVEIKHNIALIGKIFFDKQKGIQVFWGRESDKVLDQKYSYYKYDLIKDKIFKLYEEDKKYINILDYNDKSNLLLLSEKEYDDQNNTGASRILFLSGDKNIEFTDTYKFGKISKDGNYLLTINKSDLAEVRKLNDNKILHSKQLVEGKYSILSFDESGFNINNLSGKYLSQNCTSQAVIIGIENDRVTEKINDCVVVSDLSYVNENIAMILNNDMVIVNNTSILLKGQESPLEISFSSDASKFMISFKNGSIIIYETKTFQELGRMIHPNQSSHVFLDSKGYYFSNIDAGQYLWATKNNQPVTLKSIEQETFKPEKILSLFGTPNEEYLKVLQKAISIRDETKTKTVDNTAKSNSKAPIENLGKPNLYLVTIGVSDYKQSNHNLTFADKDALDMTQIYGKLDLKQQMEYNDKFYGNVFNVCVKKGSALQSMKKYREYMSVGNLYQIGQDNWVELKNEKISLWDFNQKTVDSISVPKDFILSGWGTNKKVFTYNTGFVVMGSQDAVMSYDMSAKTIKRYKLPFNTLAGNYALTGQNQWMLFDYKHVDSTSTISLSVYDAANNKMQQKLKFSPHQYNSSDDKGNLKSISVENHSSYIIPVLRAVSSNGKYLLYSTDDESIFFVDITQTVPTPLKIALNSNVLGYGSEVSLSSDGKTFSILNTNDNVYSAFTFDVSGKLIENETIENKGYSIVGFSINDAKPRWIAMVNSLLNDDFFKNKNSKVLNESSPFSFENVYALNFINKNADSKSIKSSLSHFFEKAKSNDQVVIFLAGHGLLDVKNQYYFAPHDMDFSNPALNGISFEFIVNCLKNAPAKNKLLLMDSCHSGSTLDMGSSETTSNTNHSSGNQRGSSATATNVKSNFKVSEVISSLFDNFLSTSGITILSASSGSDVAYENKELGNGAFTASYMQLLKYHLNRGSITTLDEEKLKHPIVLSNDFIAEFFKRVMLATNNKQVPDIREINDNVEIKIW